MKHLIIGFVLLYSFSAQAHTETIQWSEGEHLELGEVAADRICNELSLKNCPLLEPIFRGDQKASFRYGELIMAADYYDTPSEMYNDRAKGIKRIIQCGHDQTDVHEDQEKVPDTDYPSCLGTGIINRPQFTEVVKKNYAHFGWNNMKSYVKYHGLALKKAREAYLNRAKPVVSRQLWHQALVYNAFADHYLTDAFAAGHIRVPRLQIKLWAKENLPGFFRSLRGDLLTMVLHDRESISLRTNEEEGLLVENSRGDLWVTRSDSHLHQGSFKGDPVRELPTQAVTESLRELLTVLRGGSLPEGVYKATPYVPFYKGVPLAQKFTPAYQKMSEKEFYEAFFSNLPFYEKLIIRKADFERMFSQLPEIFATFRGDIRYDVRTNGELGKRLPASYLKAYSQIN